MTSPNDESPARRPLSPCINICELDEQLGICHGCGRTIHEISNWLKLAAAEREAVWDALPARIEQLKQARAKSID